MDDDEEKCPTKVLIYFSEWELWDVRQEGVYTKVEQCVRYGISFVQSLDEGKHMIIWMIQQKVSDTVYCNSFGRTILVLHMRGKDLSQIMVSSKYTFNVFYIGVGIKSWYGIQQGFLIWLFYRSGSVEHRVYNDHVRISNFLVVVIGQWGWEGQVYMW